MGFSPDGAVTYRTQRATDAGIDSAATAAAVAVAALAPDGAPVAVLEEATEGRWG